MDESDYDVVCPLCCDELDISDREFYPCKCGYQVCMFCWHKIRVSESGLCPACRTPYGEDPHQFSAVDVEEVLKANKEKEAAAKRERQRLQDGGGGGGGASGRGAGAPSGSGGGAGGDSNLGGGGGSMELPKDRSSLANMRVIRRNLVYAVGLPPNAATEEMLKKPEYFGQYGRISKIVTNRTHPSAAGDPRRASASAYVTFAHKEDTLSCILALDGYHLDGRNIRASYGTSKYCSAFIKNVRCNNPECTYLHEMGATEDTFTKQEIQAGYVTSGRDVLARQQLILAEQVRSGQAGALPRKRVGGGGPSGTGRVASNPVLPPPEYDEPVKPTPSFVPPPAGVARAVTSTTTALNPSRIAAKLGRSSSVGVAVPPPTTTTGGKSPPLGSSQSTHRKIHSGPVNVAAVAATPQSTMNPTTTAASVVATGRAGHKTEADSHSTLTPLTPLKRASAKPATRSSQVGGSSAGLSSSSSSSQPQQHSAGSSGDGEAKLTPLRNGTTMKATNGVVRSTSVGAMSGAPVLPSAQHLQHSASSGANLIGGDVISAPTLKPRSASLIADLGGEPLGPPPVPARASTSALEGVAFGSSGQSGDSLVFSSALGGEVFTGQLPRGSKSAIGSNSYKWNSVGQIGGSLSSAPGQFNDNRGMGGTSGPSLLHQSAPAPVRSSGHVVNHVPEIGGSVIGGSRIFSSGSAENSTSTLASILGVSLPTGSGSLQETSSLWFPSPSAPSSQDSPSPLSTLNSGVAASHDFYGNRPTAVAGSSLIGGVPIGTSSRGVAGGGGNGVSDISLLQSLLPGVHITRGTESMGLGGGGSVASFGGRVDGNGWSTAAPGPAQQSFGLGTSGLHGGTVAGGWNSSGGFAHPSAGAVGSNVGVPPGQERRGPGIW